MGARQVAVLSLPERVVVTDFVTIAFYILSCAGLGRYRDLLCLYFVDWCKRCGEKCVIIEKQHIRYCTGE